MRVLSLGAGVQSTTLLRLIIAGEVAPIDHAIFADTGWEPRPVYEHLEGLVRECEAAGIGFHSVDDGSLRDVSWGGNSRMAKRADWYPSLPTYRIDPDGGKGMGGRECTRYYKLRPIRRKIAELNGGTRSPVTQLIGISRDEVGRMKPSDVAYITNEWPLVDLGMTRHDCLLWLERHGYPRPPRSACVVCPFHDDTFWRGLRDAGGEDWDEAVDFDAALRDGRAVAGKGVEGRQFLHRSRVPLAEADLTTPEDHGQMGLFGDECEGMCGV